MEKYLKQSRLIGGGMKVLYEQDGIYVLFITDDKGIINEGMSKTFNTYQEAIEEYYNI